MNVRLVFRPEQRVRYGRDIPETGNARSTSSGGNKYQRYCQHTKYQIRV